MCINTIAMTTNSLKKLLIYVFSTCGKICLRKMSSCTQLIQ